MVPHPCVDDARQLELERHRHREADVPPPPPGVWGRWPNPPSTRAVRLAWQGLQRGFRWCHASGSGSPMATRSRLLMGSWSASVLGAPQSMHVGWAARKVARILLLRAVYPGCGALRPLAAAWCSASCSSHRLPSVKVGQPGWAHTLTGGVGAGGGALGVGSLGGGSGGGCWGGWLLRVGPSVLASRTGRSVGSAAMDSEYSSSAQSGGQRRHHGCSSVGIADLALSGAPPCSLADSGVHGAVRRSLHVLRGLFAHLPVVADQGPRRLRL